jgi:hypothetical protein
VVKVIATYAYGAGCILAAYFAYAGITALVTAKSRGGAVGVIEAISLSFLPMLALMVVTFFAQRRLKVLALPPIAIVIATALTLFFALASHWAPGFGDPLGIFHLALVAVGLAWGIRVLRGGRSNGGEPPNSTPHTDARASAVLNQSSSARAGERGR